MLNTPYVSQHVEASASSSSFRILSDRPITNPKSGPLPSYTSSEDCPLPVGASLVTNKEPYGPRPRTWHRYAGRFEWTPFDPKYKTGTCNLPSREPRTRNGKIKRPRWKPYEAVPVASCCVVCNTMVAWATQQRWSVTTHTLKYTCRFALFICSAILKSWKQTVNAWRAKIRNEEAFKVHSPLPQEEWVINPSSFEMVNLLLIVRGTSGRCLEFYFASARQGSAPQPSPQTTCKPMSIAQNIRGIEHASHYHSLLLYNASTLDSSLQRFFSTLPNASRLDFSSTLLTFYNTTRPLTLLRNIPTCENANEAGFLVRSPQGSDIQHVSICKIPPNSSKFCNWICRDRLCTSATETESQ